MYHKKDLVIGDHDGWHADGVGRMSAIGYGEAPLYRPLETAIRHLQQEHTTIIQKPSTESKNTNFDTRGRISYVRRGTATIDQNTDFGKHDSLWLCARGKLATQCNKNESVALTLVNMKSNVLYANFTLLR